MDSRNDILNELKETSSLLLHIKESEKPLVVPANYFEQLQDNILSEVYTESEALSFLKKDNIEIPANYFETFSDTVISKIKKEESVISKGKIIELPKQENKVVSMLKRTAMAASIIAAVFMVKHVQEPVTQIVQPVNNAENSIASLTQDEIYQYMNAHSNDFDLEQVEAAVQPALETEQEGNVEMNANEIEKYLKENNTIFETEDASTDIF